VCKLNTAI